MAQQGHTASAALPRVRKDQNATLPSALISYSQEFRAKGEGRPVV
jgi:hypothetical protein